MTGYFSASRTAPARPNSETLGLLADVGPSLVVSDDAVTNGGARPEQRKSGRVSLRRAIWCAWGSTPIGLTSRG